MSSKLLIPLTPPRPQDRLATMSPKEHLRNPELRSRLKSKATIDFTVERQQKLELDPRDEPSDETILDYQARVETILPERENLHVLFPFDDVIEESRERCEKLHKKVKNLSKSTSHLKSQMKNHAAHVKAQDARIEALATDCQQKDIQMSDVNAQLAAICASLQVLEAKDKANDERKLNLFIANLLAKLIDKVSALQGKSLSEGNNDATHSTNRYITFANDLQNTPKTRAKWRELTNLNSKYLTTVMNFGTYQGDRNVTAHETEHEFASLLLSDRYCHKHEHYHYGPLLEYVYGKSVGELAQVAPRKGFRGENEVPSDMDDREGL